MMVCLGSTLHEASASLAGGHVIQKVCYVYVVKLMRRALISVLDVLKGLLFGHIYLTACLWIFLLHAVNVQYVHPNDNSGLHGECECVCL